MRQTQFFNVEVVEVFNLLNLVGPQRQQLQTLVRAEALDSSNFVFIQVELLEVGVQLAVFDLLDLVACVVGNLEVCRWVEVEERFQLIVACVQLDEVLDGRKWLKCGEVVVGDIDIDHVPELLNSTDGIESSVGDVELQIGVASVVESLTEAAQSFFEDLSADLTGRCHVSFSCTSNTGLSEVRKCGL